MYFVKNPLKRDSKRTRVVDKEAINKNVTDIVERKENMNFDFTKAIKIIAKILYKREHVKKKVLIYVFDEMQKIFQIIESSLTNFFDQFYLAAWLFKCNKK